MSRDALYTVLLKDHWGKLTLHLIHTSMLYVRCTHQEFNCLCVYNSKSCITVEGKAFCVVVVYHVECVIRSAVCFFFEDQFSLRTQKELNTFVCLCLNLWEMLLFER